MDVKKIEQYLTENKPTDAESHVVAFAFVKVMYGATQKAYAEATGINDRSLRNYISDNQELYEEELERLEELKDADSPTADFSILANRAITEEMLDKFVDSLFKSAISGNARDKSLFIEWTGLTAEQVLTLQKNKAKSLRHWIKTEIGNVNQYMDTKSLGLMIETSPYIFRGNKDSKNNAQAFVDADLTDEGFKQELMYWGATFLSMMNNAEHPDLELLATAVRVDRLSKDIPEAFNKFEVKRYADADFTPEKQNKTLDELLLELCELEHGKGSFKAKEEYEEIKSQQMQNVGKAVKPPKFDKAEVKARASEYEDELKIILTAEEQMRHWMNETTKKVNKNN